MITPALNTPIRIGPCRLNNRLVALPVFTGYAAPDGHVSALLLRHYTRLAASGVSISFICMYSSSAYSHCMPSSHAPSAALKVTVLAGTFRETTAPAPARAPGDGRRKPRNPSRSDR